MNAEREVARRPEDLGRLFVQRFNAGDVDGLVAIYSDGATLATPDGPINGAAAIREFYARLLEDGPQLAPGQPQTPLVAGDLALTSARLADGTATVEVARRNADGSWQWVIDQPNVTG